MSVRSEELLARGDHGDSADDRGGRGVQDLHQRGAGENCTARYGRSLVSTAECNANDPDELQPWEIIGDSAVTFPTPLRMNGCALSFCRELDSRWRRCRWRPSRRATPLVVTSTCTAVGWSQCGGKCHRKTLSTPHGGVWIARLPQEDFCQATGRPPTQKYEADGGPSMRESLDLLNNSEHERFDRTTFLLTQLAFWLLAATDGHGKNFSLSIEAGGAYRLTPLYDVISSWPVMGPGPRQLALQKAKLAMAVRGKRAHYRLNEILGRHWAEIAEKSGIHRICASRWKGW